MSALKRAALALVTAGVASSFVPNATAVVNGEDAPRNAATEAAVAIFMPNNTLCSGTLVDNNWILTAAHCFNDDQGENVNHLDKINVFATGMELNNGVAYYDNDTLNAQLSNSLSYSGVDISYPSDNTDLALVHLPQAVPGVKPAPIADKHADAGAQAYSVGWGNDSRPENNGQHLKGAPATVSTYHHASDSTRIDWGDLKKYSDGMYYLSKYEQGYLREGDSGGPLIVDGKVAGVLSAYVTATDGEEIDGQYASHSSVADNYKWIQDTISKDDATNLVDVSFDTKADNSKKIPFTITNKGADAVSKVNIEVLGESDIAGAKVVVDGKEKDIADYTVTWADVDKPDGSGKYESVPEGARPVTGMFDVNIKPGESVSGYVDMANAADGKYRLLGYAVPGFRPQNLPIQGSLDCAEGSVIGCVPVAYSAAEGSFSDKTGPVEDTPAEPPVNGEDTPADPSDTPVDPSDTPTGPSEDIDVPADPSDNPAEPPVDGEDTPSDPSDGDTGSVPDNMGEIVVPDDSVDGAESPEPGDVDSGSVENGSVDSSDHSESPVQGEDNRVVENPEQVDSTRPAASQRVLADTGVKSMAGLLGMGLAVIAVGVTFAVRRRA